MIFPIIKGIVYWKNAPITYLLILLNVFFWLIFDETNINKLEQYMKDRPFVVTQARLYSEHVLKNKESYSDRIQKMSEDFLNGVRENDSYLTGLAFKDYQFINSINIDSSYVDPIAYTYWKQRIDEIQDMILTDPTFFWGINFFNSDFFKWISYQFVHSGFSHLFSNMIFLLIFGAALELTIGSFATFFAYLMFGFVSAAFFLMFSQTSTIPLVGASGSISGVMALFCVLHWRSPVRYVWFVSFNKGYHGIVYLPAWIAFIYWIVADFAGFLSSLPELGGVAYLAHLGGEVSGFIAAAVILLLRKWENKTLASI